MILCAGEIESFPFARAIGIGLIDVASNLTALVLKQRPQKLLFVGTAGSYGRRKPLELCHAFAATQLEACFFRQGCYSPIENKIVTEPPSDVSRETVVTVNSSNYITTDASIAQHYLRYNIDLENMEFFAVMRIAQRFGLPVEGVFVVSNYCDAHAHQAFLANHEEAKQKLEAYLQKKGYLS